MDTLTRAQRSALMGRVRQKNTLPEVMLRRGLWKNGLRYRLHTRLPGHPDIVFVKAKIAIFVDGCFWHGCPIHGKLPKTNTRYWAKKLADNKERDQRIDQELKELGFYVIHIWEHSIKKDLDNVVEYIAELVPQRTP